jgi:hypothetical protein
MGVLARLAVIWAAIVLLWAAIVSVNVPTLFAHGGGFAVLLVALGPLVAVWALGWAFRARK